ncbi:MAG: DEAD/DEAH box helicase [Verrucomicrobiota bacterium]
MHEPFELLDPDDAHEFIGSFDANTRRKGEAYFREGRVTSLRPEAGGTAFLAAVQGSQLYEVDLFLDPIEGWTGSCSCPLEFDCKHVYAAMKSLLAEHSVASVRGLSAGATGKIVKAPGSIAQPKPPKPAVAPGEFAQTVAEALGRPLRPEETKLLLKLHAVYSRCGQKRSITKWDFEDLGLSLGGYGWDALHIWPSFPGNEHEFWLYLANALMEHQRSIPEFLKPVTDLNIIQDGLRRWRRGLEIEQWKQTLNNLAPAGAGTVAPGGEFDLRVVLNEAAASLQWKPAGSEVYEELKATKARQLADDHREGRLTFSSEAELLWQLFQQRLFYGRSLQLNYHDSEAREMLGRMLRLRLLDSRIVDAQGRPLARPGQPLRWEVAAAASENEDYRFRLAQADGAPPPLWCALPGHPPLYLAAGAVFTGPPLHDSVLDPARENVIPAPALETRAGLEFLQSLGVELPPRVRERVRHVPMHAVIRCELKPIYPGSKTENCLVRAVAESADGFRQETWNGRAWSETPPHRAFKGNNQGETFITLYDRSTLDEVTRLLQPLDLKFDGYTGVPALRVTKRFPEIFVPWLKSLPPHIAVRLAGDLASLAHEAVSGQVRLDVTETAIDWFDLRVVLDVSDTTLTPEEIKLLLDAKGRFVRLGQKGWRRLQFDLTEADDEKLARLGLNPHELTSEPQRLHALQLADESAKKFLPEQQVEQIQRRAGEIKARVTPDLPAGVTAQLRPYQLEGFHFLAYLATNHFGGILADDMGLGKTLQALAWLVWLRGEFEISNLKSQIPPSLVVCPKSVMDNWHAEAARFTPGLRVKSWAASELHAFLDRLAEADLHVLNYSQLRMVGESLAPVPWLAVILDEGQYIKNPNSQTAQVARALRANYRLVLSGTPIENRLLDLWSLMTFAMPGVLSSRNHFARLFDAKDDPFARRRLAARVRPFLLRRTKSQVAKDLPDRIEEDLYCEIEGEQKTLYRAELKRAQQLLLKVKTQKQLAKERFHFLTSLLRLRQICCHPALVRPDSKAPSAKLEALLEQLEPLMDEGHKVLVFSQFVALLALLKPAIAERGWPMFYLAGETENRGPLVQQFQSAEGAAVFLISLKAGGFGLNLTAASYVVLFDPWWNPAVENQAIDRTHRIGQANKVIAYRLLIKDSIEGKIRALQKQKKALAEDVLGEEKFAQSLTLDDLQFLFAD